MKEEAIELLKFGVSLVFLSILLFYVSLSIIQGKNIGTQFLNKSNQIQVNSQMGALKELSDVEKIMPAATIFSLLEYNSRNIRQIICFVCDPINGEVRDMNENLCITSHLKGEVKVLIEYNDAYGMYDVVIWPAS